MSFEDTQKNRPRRGGQQLFSASSSDKQCQVTRDRICKTQYFLLETGSSAMSRDAVHIVLDRIGMKFGVLGAMRFPQGF